MVMAAPDPSDLSTRALMQVVFRRMSAAVVLLAITSSAAGQAAPERTTQAGVYTAAQAARGQDTFAGQCQACHTPADYTSPAFSTAWVGKMLSELFSFVSQNMPKSDPGSLQPGEYAQVVAYLLKLNGMPDGEQELPADSVALKSIRFEVPTKK